MALNNCEQLKHDDAALSRVQRALGLIERPNVNGEDGQRPVDIKLLSVENGQGQLTTVTTFSHRLHKQVTRPSPYPLENDVIFVMMWVLCDRSIYCAALDSRDLKGKPPGADGIKFYHEIGRLTVSKLANRNALVIYHDSKRSGEFPIDKPSFLQDATIIDTIDLSSLSRAFEARKAWVVLRTLEKAHRGHGITAPLKQYPLAHILKQVNEVSHKALRFPILKDPSYMAYLFIRLALYSEPVGQDGGDFERPPLKVDVPEGRPQREAAAQRSSQIQSPSHGHHDLLCTIQTNAVGPHDVPSNQTNARLPIKEAEAAAEAHKQLRDWVDYGTKKYKRSQNANMRALWIAAQPFCEFAVWLQVLPYEIMAEYCTRPIRSSPTSRSPTDYLDLAEILILNVPQKITKAMLIELRREHVWRRFVDDWHAALDQTDPRKDRHEAHVHFTTRLGTTGAKLVQAFKKETNVEVASSKLFKGVDNEVNEARNCLMREQARHRSKTD